MANEEEKTALGCFFLMFLLACAVWGFLGWMLYEVVMWLTSK